MSIYSKKPSISLDLRFTSEGYPSLSEHRKAMMNHLVAVTAFFVCLKLATAEVCGEGWLNFNKNCYFFSDSAETWYAASEICYGLGGHLIRITSRPENEWLKPRAKAKNFQSCLILWKGFNYQWCDVSCTYRGRYICEKEIENHCCCCTGQKD